MPHCLTGGEDFPPGNWHSVAGTQALQAICGTCCMQHCSVLKWTVRARWPWSPSACNLHACQPCRRAGQRCAGSGLPSRNVREDETSEVAEERSSNEERRCLRVSGSMCCMNKVPQVFPEPGKGQVGQSTVKPGEDGCTKATQRSERFL